MSNIILNVNGIEVIYNHVILVLKGVSLQVPEGGIVALLGGNGAGKTTTLRAVSNLLAGERGEVTKGSIELRGERIEKLSTADMVERGVIQVMEGRHCFAHLTIEDNLMAGAYTRRDGKAAVAQTRRFSATESRLGRSTYGEVKFIRGSADSRSRRMSTPSTRISPSVGSSTPSSIDSVVVLPAPLPPSSAVVVPLRTAKLTPLTASTRR